MRGLRALLVGIVLVASATGCSSGTQADPTQSGIPQQTIDPSLIPVAAPSDAVVVDPIIFDSGYGDFTFKVGDGPAWCTINQDQAFAICEIDEAAAQYDPIDIPASCDYSYGYQFRLRDRTASGTSLVDLPCSGGAYADATNANVLMDHQKITISGITCWVDNLTARCDNTHGNYIALGPNAWALH